MAVAWRSAMVSTLQAIDGSSPYTLDLSGTGAVIEGTPPTNHRSSLGAVAYVYRLPSEYSRGGMAPLRSWDVTQRVGVSFYVEPDSSDGADREAAMDAIIDDLHSAIAASVVPGGPLALAGPLNCSEIRVIPFYGSQQSRKAHPVIVDAELTFMFIDDGST